MFWMMMDVNLNPVHYQIDPQFDTMEQVGKYLPCDLFVSLLQRPHLSSCSNPERVGLTVKNSTLQTPKKLVNQWITSPIVGQIETT